MKQSNKKGNQTLSNEGIRNVFIIASVFALFLVVGCVEDGAGTAPKQTDKKSSTVMFTGSDFETSDAIKKFESRDEIITFLQEAQRNQNYGYNNVFRRGFGDDVAVMAMEESADAAAAPQAAVKSTSGGASDFSETNIQVAGVDEADFVKNDGKYIYIASQNRYDGRNGNVVIVDAFPADDADIVSEIDFDGQVLELFVNEDRMVVFVAEDDRAYILPVYDIIPRQRYVQNTHAYVYDVSDRSDPELVHDFNLKGNYFDARMIGDYVYFVVKDSVYFYNDIVDVPVLRESDSIIAEPDVFYFDNPEGNYVFHTVAGFDINGDEIDAKTFMMGWSNTLFVSKENMYIAYQKNLPYYWYQQNNEDRFYDVVVPLLPDDIQDEIESLRDKEMSSSERWSRISSLVEDMYNEMDERTKDILIDKVNEAVEEYTVKLEIERRKTVIHKINIEDGKIDYDTKGEVEGHLLNQFSMDEHDGNLRVATTTFVWSSRDNTMYNNVYVLDSDLDVIGELEDIAPEERIYSARFIGDRLYMVTFKNIDPFFVIDLSDPKDPEILGELKIPGFSDYLHPYDENHIIGIGKETEGNQWGGVSTKGVKLALFDVSDVSNPTQVDTYEIGEAGTDSEALRDHKAFLFDREKDLLVIPVREVTGRYKDPRYGYYRNEIWQGAYVFSLNPKDGFDVKGTITHEDKEDDDYYWNSPNAVRRSLYMDDVLYTISSEKILMNDLDDLEDEINRVKLPLGTKQRYDDEPEPWPIGVAREEVAVDSAVVADSAPSEEVLTFEIEE